jgi:hypothetical protein
VRVEEKYPKINNKTRCERREEERETVGIKNSFNTHLFTLISNTQSLKEREIYL